MPAPDSIKQLVDRFEAQRSSYQSARYNETETRRELIDPFFRALGWDVDNSQHYAEAYKDVVHEDAIKIGGVTKAPDYAFRIGGTRKFFVEAKKPSVNVRDEIPPAYQLRRYAWTAKLPLSILTDFDEFAVYDCRQKPDRGDKASTGRILYLNCADYIHRWDEIAGIFSRDAILRGSFDRYAEETRGKHGTTSVDDAFLAEIEKWRDLLAHNIALRNPGLNQRALNYAVQMTVDRIIFLRICEDRGIEQYGRLQGLVNGNEIYPRLTGLFRLADQRYNSGLFHFTPEKGQSDAPDELTTTLQIDDKVLKEILSGLYYPDSPYEFSVLPANILGQVYEQFLGKVIRLTPGHHAVVEDKPEVKKAGGVYYTPEYIVEYIVKHTVGALLEGKQPGDVGAGRGQPLRVLDPACGSGSFLLGAYQFLLDWYRDGYIAAGTEKWCKGKNPTLYQTMKGEWRLTTAERKRILLDHIYGVDIDSQAVEVTKLSLLLKVLEGESDQTLQTMLDFYKERVLPNLGQNIKCGNSLIGPDFYTQGTQLALFDEEEQYRINAFDWEGEFSHVFMHSGGFDAVIGNPPYIRIQALKEWAPKEVEFYKKKYKSASKGNYDIYVVFVEKGLSLLSSQGKLGFILPHRFFKTEYGEPLRNHISDSKALHRIINFGDLQIFNNATTYTCLLFLQKNASDKFVYEQVEDLNKWKSNEIKNSQEFPSEKLMGNVWNLNIGDHDKLIHRLSEWPRKMNDISNIFVGLQTSADTVYLFKQFTKINESIIRVYSKEMSEWFDLEIGALKKVIRSGSIGRNWINNFVYVLFPYDISNNEADLLSPAEFQNRYPLAWDYLLKNKKLLEKREKGAFTDTRWYRFGRNQNLGAWEQKKLLVPYMVTELSSYYDENDNFYFINITTGGYGITIKNKDVSYHYLNGILNSKLMSYYLQKTCQPFHGGYFGVQKRFLEKLPIMNFDSSNPADVKNHDRMVALVERMLSLNKQAQAAVTPQEKDMLQRQIVTTDREIDHMVYELYGLTAEEVKTVEGETA